MNDYTAITNLLKSDSSLSLSVGYFPVSAGAKHIRFASVYGSNSNKGRLEGDSDQVYITPNRVPLRNLHLLGRDAKEALNLLEKACLGERVESTVYGTNFPGKGPEESPGYDTARPGFDKWLFNGFDFFARADRGILKAGLYLPSSTFLDSPVVISSKEVESVGDAVALFQGYRQKNPVVRNIKKGIQLRQSLLNIFGINENNGSGFLDGFYGGILDPDLVEEFESARRGIPPLGFKLVAEDALLLAMLSKELYGIK